MNFLSLLAFVALTVGVFIGFPLIQEDVGSECSALEHRLIRLASHDKVETALLKAFQGSFSRGAVAAALIDEKYPHLPRTIGCAAAYWQIVFNPDPDILIPKQQWYR